MIWLVALLALLQTPSRPMPGRCLQSRGDTTIVVACWFHRPARRKHGHHG